MTSIDRNAPCPCGSGKKYKKCCAWKDATAAAAARVQSTPVREAAAWKSREGALIAEIKPDVDKAVDRLLARLERGETGGIRAEIESLYQRYPRYHMTNYAMGVYLGMAEQDAAGSIPYFQEAVRIFPFLAEGHFNLGSAFFSIGRVPEAVSALRDAIQYSSDDDALGRMAQDKINDLERIITHNSPFKALDAYIENEELFNVAFEHLSNQRYHEAARAFEKVLENNPEHIQTHGNLGICYASLGRKADALASLNRALEYDPSYEPALSNVKLIAQMTEGRPQPPKVFAATEYYREQYELKREKRKGLFGWLRG